MSTERLQAYNNLGINLALKGNFEAAEVAFLRALGGRDDPGVRANYANVLRRLWRFEEAQKQIQQADQSDDFTRYVRGSIAYETGHAAKAIFHLTQIKELTAQHRFCQAMAYLQAGQWTQGFEAYESRHEVNTPLQTQIPRWNGQQGRILAHHEQGFGDTLMMARFAYGMTLSLPGPLVRLFQYGSRVEALSVNAPLGEIDYIVPLMSVPHIAGIDRIEPPRPYLKAPVEYPAPTPPGTKFKVGLVWTAKATGQQKGLEETLHGHQKSIPLELLLPLATLPGVACYGLQTGEAAKDIKRIGAESLILDLSPGIMDFADLAGFMASMDLIVSVDTAPLHLAGAMGKPAIGLLCYPGSWQWMEGDKTPWYTSITLIRQPQPFDWKSAVAHVYTAIEGAMR